MTRATSREFRCDQCGGVFEKKRTDEDAEAEAKNLWGVENASTAPGMAVVCDECYREIMSDLDDEAMQ